MTDDTSPAEGIVTETPPDDGVEFEREYGAVGARVAIADVAVQTLDAAIQALKNQRKVANATLTLRLHEHTEFMTAHRKEIRARYSGRAAIALAEPAEDGR